MRLGPHRRGNREERDLRDKPARPAVTAAFGCGCMFWATCAASYTCGQHVESTTCLVAALALLAAFLLALATCAVLGRYALAIAAASALLGLALGFSAAAALHVEATVQANLPEGGASLRLLADTRETSSGECAFARVTLQDGREVVAYADFGSAGPYLAGDNLLVTGVLSRADWSTDDYLWQNGAAGRLRVKSCEPIADTALFAPMRSVRARAIEAIGCEDDNHALLQALVCGYRRNIMQTALYARFQECGLAHLVAVSGAHLVIVTGLASVLLDAMRIPRRLTIALLIGLMVSYLVVSGVPVSALRATLMSSVGILALFGRRRPSAQNALGLGLFAIIGASPAASVSVSFSLSALSTAGIVLFAPLVRHWLEDTPFSCVPGVVESLALTAASALSSQLYASSVFHQLPIASFIANVVCAPVFPLACGMGLIAGLACSMLGPYAGGLIAVATLPARLLSALVGLVSSLPYASIPVSIGTCQALAVTACIAFALWAAWPAVNVRAVAPLATAVLLAACVFAHIASLSDAIVMLDVGQGDAFLVRSRGQTLLVDTGNRDGQLLEQLASCGAFRIDSVLVTHNDDDHCGSLDALERGVDVRRVVVAEGLLHDAGEKNGALLDKAERTASKLVGVSAGDSFKVGAFLVRVVWPEGLSDGGGNADSVCLLLEYDGDDDGEVDFKAFFTGDAEIEQLAAMLKAGTVGDIDLLKVGHHGSRNAMTLQQARALSPEIALIGVGEGNRYGHPAPEILDMLGEVGCKVFRSDRDGQVKCTFTPDSIRVALQ